MQQLQHPHVVKYLEAYEDHKKLYLVMGLCNEGDLETMVKKFKEETEGGIPEAECARIIGRVLQALNFCHGQGIVHRDIKAENVMFANEGNIRVVDFGFASPYNKLKEN
jgi:serine/threonine protein kinase